MERTSGTSRSVPSAVVYMVQEDPNKNVLGALEFGSMERLLEYREEVTLFNTPAIVQRIRHGLRNMTPQDYILPIGNPLSIGIAFAVAAELTGGRFNALKWDGQETRYFSVSINLHPEQ